MYGGVLWFVPFMQSLVSCVEELTASLADRSLDHSPEVSPVCGGEALDSSGEAGIWIQALQRPRTDCSDHTGTLDCS